MRVITLWWHPPPPLPVLTAGSLYTRYAISRSATDLGPQCQRQQVMTADELDRMRQHHQVWQRERQWPYLVREDHQRNNSTKERDVKRVVAISNGGGLVLVRCPHTHTEYVMCCVSPTVASIAWHIGASWHTWWV